MSIKLNTIYSITIAAALIFSSLTYANEDSGNILVVDEAVKSINHSEPNKNRKCRSLQIDNIKKNDADITIAQKESSDRTPNCCGQCNANGRDGCDIYIDGSWVCSAC